MKRILRASAVMAGSSAVTILAGLIRNKIIAVLLGPSGVGLYGLLQSVQSTAGLAAGLGFSSSGVRQVAEANASADQELLPATRQVMRALGVACSCTAAALTFFFRDAISHELFGPRGDPNAVAWASVGVFATGVVGVYSAWLNGLHRLRELALSSALGAALSVPLTVPLLFLMGAAGIAPAVAVGAWTTLLTTRWFAGRSELVPSRLSWKRAKVIAGPLLSGGVAFMATSLLSVGMQAAVRVLLTRRLGPGATGHFQAAWSISMLYAGFVIQAMSADFFPRLTGMKDDPEAAGELINEQTEAGLLLAAPFMFGVLALAPWLVSLLYSGTFGDTVIILRWQILGDVLKVASFPLAYALLARGLRVAYFVAELAWSAVYLVVVWVALPSWGTEATGFAFVLAYAVYLVVVLWVVRGDLNYRMEPRLLLYELSLFVLATAVVLLSRATSLSWVPVLVWLLVTGHALRRLAAAGVGRALLDKLPKWGKH